MIKDHGQNVWNRIKPLKNALKQELNLPPIDKFVIGWNCKLKQWQMVCLNKEGKFQYESYPYGEYDGLESLDDGTITHWQEYPTEPFNHDKAGLSDES